MKLCRTDLSQQPESGSLAHGRRLLRAWLWMTLLIALPFVLASWCTLEFPGQAKLIGNVLASALGGDARYWSRAQWRADAVTLEAARRWMFDLETAETTPAEMSFPAAPMPTNSDLITPAV
jgi:hypothetical protein